MFIIKRSKFNDKLLLHLNLSDFLLHLEICIIFFYFLPSLVFLFRLL